MPSIIISARARSPAARNPSAKRETQAIFARSRCSDGAPGERLGLGGALELQRISARSSALSGPSRLLAGRASIVGERPVGLAALGCVPGGQKRRQETQIAAVGGNREPRLRPIEPVVLQRVGGEEQACFIRQLGRRNFLRETERKIHPPGADRLAKRFARDIRLVRLRIRQ